MGPTSLARFWPPAALLISGLMLAVAHASQTFGGLEPCELCLKQREIYWIIIGAAALFTLGLRLRARLLRPACILLGLLFLSEAALAAYHAGVEWKFWPGPASCTGAGAHAVSVSDMAALLKGNTQKVVQCDVAAFRFLGLSMAGWNALAALALAAVSVIFAAGVRSPERAP